ncbi:MAG: hypothetical protein IPM42_09440 [Saprospiraceae bacterium]|nr:hypothetical protein [Saprospiraceae bacterium]
MKLKDLPKDHPIWQPKPEGFTDAIYMSGAIEDLSKMMKNMMLIILFQVQRKDILTA